MRRLSRDRARPTISSAGELSDRPVTLSGPFRMGATGTPFACSETPSTRANGELKDADPEMTAVTALGSGDPEQ